MKDAPKLLKIPKSECLDVWVRLPRHKWPKSWSNIEDPAVPLRRNLYGHPLAGLLWQRQFESSVGTVEKVPNWECLFVRREQGLFLSVHVDDIKMAGRKQNLSPMRKKLMKLVDLGEPTSFIPWPRESGMHSTWIRFEWTHFWGIHKKNSNHDFLQEQLRNDLVGRTSRWNSRSVIRYGRLSEKARGKILRTANEKTEQLCKVSTPCLDDHHFKKEELESVGELSKVCSQIV